LEDGNSKLSAVVTDSFGVPATRIIEAMLGGETEVEELVKLCHGKMQPKVEQLKEALPGKLSEHHKVMMRTLKNSIAGIEQIIEQVEEQIEEQTKAYQAEIELLQTVLGVGKETAIGIVAEIGVELEVFPNELHLASWAAMSLGNNESAGKGRSAVDAPRTEINI